MSASELPVSNVTATQSVAGKPVENNSTATITLLLCGAAAVFEGFDNQSMGVAAPRLVAEFALSSAEKGWIFSAAAIGLAIGAVLGGRAADFFGRKRVLIVSLILFGIFSILTSFATGPLSFFLARLLTGLGLGGAMPNFIALSSEAVRSDRRLSATTIVMAGMPFGGSIAALVALGEQFGWGWRTIFYVGGIGPIVVALIMMRALPESRRSDGSASDDALLLRPVIPAKAGVQRKESSMGPDLRRDDPVHGSDSRLRPPRMLEMLTMQEQLSVRGNDDDLTHPKVPSIWTTLFGAGRAPTTLLLWTAFFFTQLVLLLMLNWLPTLIVGLGFTTAEASWTSLCFNLCGSIGAIFLGRMHAGAHRRMWAVLTYLGIALALALIPAVGKTFLFAAIACGLAGIFTVGAQLILFALAPLYYERSIRGTGVGASVAVGRVGSIVGPLFASALLVGGGSSATVLIGILPFVAISGAAALGLCWRRQAD